MSIYVIGDLHLSFGVNKPMNIFGENWEKHYEKIKENWLRKVKDEDTVILPGDFSWATYLEESEKDFEFLNNLSGNKILLEGNHDYWWTTVTKMKKFLEEKNIQNIHFLYNNSFLIENKIIAGTRGWIINPNSKENYKILKRENDRLKLSLESGIKSFGEDKEIIAFLHYPPFYKDTVSEEIDFKKTLENYKVKKCFYGHLHSDSHKEAIEGKINGIEYCLVSSDYLKFDLLKL